MKKRTVSLLLTLLLVLSFTALPSFASENGAVYDLAGIFTDDEITRINAAAKEYFSDNGCSVYIVTSPEYEYSYWGEDFLYEHPEADSNAVILIFANNSDDNYDMYTYGKCDRRISNSEVNEILDDPEVYDNIKFNDDYTSAAIRFIKLSSEACKPQIALAIVIGVISGLITVACVAAYVLVTYNKKQRSEKYPLERYASLKLEDSRDMFAGSFITKKIINSDRGRGGFGGGGRSGGGGGHRGGR